jgi:serine kinase of HPr protein (carbohydrate metabolism regulator)
LSDTQPVHATLAAIYTPRGWRGALLRGPSGVGKSALALALIGKGWRLVADDRVLVWRCGDRVWGRAPEVLHGLLEVRSVGVLPFAALAFAEIAWVIDCVAGAADLERIPGPDRAVLCGVERPRRRIDAAAPTAADTLAAFCDALRV